MRSLNFRHEEAVERFAGQVAEFLAAAHSLDERRLLSASRCHGWSVLDLVVHVRLGLEEMAVGTTSLCARVPDHDAASYWATHPDDRDDDPVPHILWLRRVASAYARPAGALRHLQDVATRAATAVNNMNPGVVEFQSKRMDSGDFIATWVVELAVHQLDLGRDGESPAGLAWARQTLEAIADVDLPAQLDDAAAVLAGLGREPLNDTALLEPPYPITL